MSRDNEEFDASYDKHPALRNFNRTAFMAKHVIKGALKWGAIAAVAGVAAVGAMSIFAGLQLGIFAPIIAAVAYFIPEVATAGKELALSTLGSAAGGGGLIGAAVGGIVAISGASEAADAEEDRLVAKFEQKEARKDRMLALERRRDEQKFAMERQSESMRGGPGAQVPRGKPGHGAGHAHA